MEQHNQIHQNQSRSGYNQQRNNSNPSSQNGRNYPPSHQAASSGNDRFPNNTNNRVVKTDEKDFGIKFVAYGGKAAFQVSTTKTKDKRDTISIESANKLNPNDANDRKLDWNNKLLFQLSLNELPVFIAVMLGYVEKARFDLHGACNSKYLEVINQQKNFYFKSGSQDIQMKVAPVSVADATHFGMLALGAYAQNFPGLSSETTLTGLKILVKRLLETNSIKIPK